MYILGISAFYHDSAACLIKDGEIIAAAQEERFTRKKHDAGFPYHAIEYCLKDDKLGDPLISKEHILAFKWAEKKELEKIDKQLHRINDFMVGMFRGVGIKLVDFKVEFWTQL